MHFARMLVPMILAASVVAEPASALQQRAWVAVQGADITGCGPRLTPCRSFQYVLDNVVAPGGDISVLEAGGYGPMIIRNSVSIINDGVGTVICRADAGTAIDIQAGSTDSVHIKGLTVENRGAAQIGLFASQLGSLTVANATFKNFGSASAEGFGIKLLPTSGRMHFFISDVELIDNKTAGLSVEIESRGLADGVIQRAVATGNDTGLNFASRTTTGFVNTTVLDSVASNNRLDGLAFSGARTRIVAINVTASDNNANGFAARSSGPSHLRLSRSNSTGNRGFGVFLDPGADVLTYLDNRIENNLSGDRNGSFGPAVGK